MATIRVRGDASWNGEGGGGGAEMVINCQILDIFFRLSQVKFVMHWQLDITTCAINYLRG